MSKSDKSNNIKNHVTNSDPFPTNLKKGFTEELESKVELEPDSKKKHWWDTFFKESGGGRSNSSEGRGRRSNSSESSGGRTSPRGSTGIGSFLQNWQFGASSTEGSRYEEEYLTEDTKLILSETSNSALRNWWHELLRTHDKYSCCMFFLLLTSDKNTYNFLVENIQELDQISGSSALIIFPTKSGLQTNLASVTKFRSTIKEYATEGYSIEIARYFGFGTQTFPCMVIFQDVRSSEHLLVSLKGMNEQELSQTMRGLFDTIHDAALARRNPIAELQDQRDLDKFKKAGNSIISGMQFAAGKTFEAAMEAVFKAYIK